MTAVVGAVLAACADRLGADATAVLARLAGPLGDAARLAARDLSSLEAAALKRRRAELLARARTPALRDVHPSWIEAALADLPPRARAAIAGESSEPIDVWLARWATSSFPPAGPPGGRPAGPPTGPGLFDRESLPWLVSIAHDQLAFALGAAAPPRLAAASSRITTPPRHNALGPHRAALLRCRGASLDDTPSLLAIAARALAPHLADNALVRLELTRRLPYDLGTVVERELVANAATSLDQVPTWAALVAG